MDAQKKKTILVGILLAVMLGVGAFQFVGGGEEKKPDKKEASKSDAKADGANGAATNGDATEKLKDLVANNQISEDNPAGLVYSIPLNPRDPFSQGGVVLEKPAGQDAQSKPDTQAPAPSGGMKPPPLGGMTPGGPIAPFPIPGTTGGMPGGPQIGGNIGVQPGAPVRQPGEFAFVPVGVIDGAHPAVVFMDDSGNQILVPLGGSVGPGSVVTKIENNKITVRHQKKNLTFTVGGTPNAQ